MVVERTVYAIVPDLFDRGRFSKEVQFVSTAQLSLEPNHLLIIDLDKTDLSQLVGVDGFKAENCIGFASHVNHEAFLKAQEFGIQRTMPRSKFFGNLQALLQ